MWTAHWLCKKKNKSKIIVINKDEMKEKNVLRHNKKNLYGVFGAYLWVEKSFFFSILEWIFGIFGENQLLDLKK